MKNQIKIFGIFLSLFLMAGCASIIHGSMQNVDITSQPIGARIYIDGEDLGKTPHTVSLRRKGRAKGDKSKKDFYAVKIELDGYYPYELKIKREMDGWFLGNLLFGGVIGVIIDASNGSMYKLTPDQIIAQMKGANTMIDTDNGQLYVSVTLTADPAWEKIGELQVRE